MKSLTPLSQMKDDLSKVWNNYPPIENCTPMDGGNYSNNPPRDINDEKVIILCEKSESVVSPENKHFR